jgi:uncharacterized repeat protein (TIGR03803 family)
LFSFNGADGNGPAAGLTADANCDLFGTTSGGGASGQGTVFEIENTGTIAAPIYASPPTTLVSFLYVSEGPYGGENPEGGVILDANGNLFGTTWRGGANSSWGTVFEIKNTGTLATPIYANTPTTLASFDYTNGGFPHSELVADANGDLFGTTSEGGESGSSAVWGTVFEITNTGTVTAPIYASIPTTLVTFNGSNGSTPGRGLIVDANGDLFGTTNAGGANGRGTVFELQNTGTVAAPVYATSPTTLVSFDGSDGSGPDAGLIADANGDLFGTTGSGGANGYGTVFEIKNTGTIAAPVYASTPITLVSFDGSDGRGPSGGLIADANGDLFGATTSGGAYGYGTVFEIQNNGTIAAPVYASTPITLVSFDGSNGQNPQAALIADANGDLFGTTELGGALGDGTAFEITGAGFIPAPTISGTAGGQTTMSEAPVKPFAHVMVGDANAGATDTLTIALGGAGGTLADGVGFNGLRTSGGGVYTLSGSASAITGELDALVFTSKAGAANTSSTTKFTLSDVSSAAGAPAVDSTTTVIDMDPPVGPTITGTTAGQTTAKEALVSPFSRVTIGDANVGATDTLTISLGGTGGTLIGSGLILAAGGFYTLSGTAAAITSELDALIFWPKAGTPNTSATTTFRLSDQSSAYGTPTVDNTTSVIDSDLAIAGTVAGQMTTSETPVKPFAHVTIGDANVGATDTLTISVGGSGGTLTGTGLSGGSGAVYTLSGTPSAITSELDGLVFTPRAGAPSTASTTTFTLSVLSSVGGAPAVDSTTTVIDIEVAPPPQVIHPNNLTGVIHPNNLALSGDVTGPRNFIDMPNFVASYGDLIDAFGTNQEAAQNWYNKREPIENRAETFDGLDYVASYGDLINAFKSEGSERAVLDSGATHFIQYGYHEGRTTTFNGLDYIASYGDLINALGANGDAGANHYIENGASEGRTTTFDGLDYIASYSDLINALGANEQAGAEHLIQHGYSEGRTTTFNGLDYIASYGDLIQAFGANNDAGATHYINFGNNEVRTTTFDGLDYIASYSDLIKALGANEQAGASHFIDHGHKEGRTTTFDGLAYIANYPDLMNALGANNDAGATHYINNGFSEHRSTSFNVGAYESAHLDLIGKYASNDAFLTAYINTYKTTGTFLT